MAFTSPTAKGAFTPFSKNHPPLKVKAAGGILADGRVALDTGLLRFDSEMTARLTELSEFRNLPCRRFV